MRKISALVIVASLAACGSKTFVSGHPTRQAQFVHVAANVEGALATSEYGDRCRTPCNLPLLADRGGAITISAPGFASQRHLVGSEYLLVEPPPSSISGSVFKGGGLSGVKLGASASLGGPRKVAILDEGYLLVELAALTEGEADPLGADELTSGQRYTLDEWEARAK